MSTEAIDVNAETVVRFYRALEQICNIAQAVLGKGAAPEWKCPECGNIFSRLDGSWVCTQHKHHYCSLPDDIRRLRDLRNLGLK
jgi:rubrerythrin